MTAPNLLRMNFANGKSYPFVVTTSDTTIAANPGGSSLLYKINSIFVANTDPEVSADLTVSFVRAGVSYKIVSTIRINADSSLVVLGKDTTIYLEAGDSLTCSASADASLTGVISYEIIQ